MRKIPTWLLVCLASLVTLIAVGVAVGQTGDDPAPAQTVAKKAGPPGNNLNYRTRIFLRQLRGCQAAVEATAQILQTIDDRVQLADATVKAKDVCDSVRYRMATMDTRHFYDQAGDTEIAVDEYSKGLSDVSDYIDTFAPSKAANARQHIENGAMYARQAFAAINERRAVYGLPPLVRG